MVASGGMEEDGGSLMVDGGCKDDDSMDSSQDAEASLDQSLIIPLASELVKTREMWVMLWKWLPEWVTQREPRCLFSSSQDGYKYVQYLS